MQKHGVIVVGAHIQTKSSSCVRLSSRVGHNEPDPHLSQYDVGANQVP